MKKLVLSLVLFLGLSATAMASEGPFWTCKMDYKAKASGIQIFIGKFTFKGKGDISCVSIYGERESYPITIEMKAKKVALRIAIGKMTMNGKAVNIGLFTRDPRDLLGKYRLAYVQGSAGLGIGAFSAVQLGYPNIDFSVATHVTKGFGAAFGLSKMYIELDEERM